LKWIGSEPGAAAYLGGIALGRASNWQEFQKALPHWKVPSLNFMYADVDGHIGWVAGGAVPVRNGWDGLLPVPGPRGLEWQRFLTVPELPQAFDPPQHYLATANHNILPAKYSNMIAYEWAPSYRIDRIRQRFQDQKKFDLTDMQSMQHDVTSLPGQALAKLARQLKVAPGLQPHVKLLAGWDGALTVDSSAGSLFAAWQDELLRAFYGQAAPAAVQDLLRANRGLAVMLAELEKPTAAWFGQRPEPARDALLTQTFARAVDRIQGLLGDDPRQWTWGKLHLTKFEHPLASLGKPHAEAFNLAPVPYGGDGNTPNNGRFNDKFEKIHGASYRQVFDLADWDRGQATSVPGQSAQPGSPHYGDLRPLWEKGEYFPLAFSRNKVEEMTRHRLRLNPAQ
jgi:penicillin amidase